MKLDDGVYAEVCEHRTALRKRFSGVTRGAVKRALSEVTTGRRTGACLDMLRALVNLIDPVVDNSHLIEQSVHIVRDKMKREASTFLTPEHVVGYKSLVEAWYKSTIMRDDESLDKRDIISAYVFRDLTRLPYVVEAISRGVLEPGDVRELVNELRQTHPAIGAGAL